MASLLDARPLGATQQVRVNAYRTAQDDADRRRAAEEQDIALRQAEGERRAAEDAQKRLLPVATADLLQWTADPAYQKDWSQQPQELKSHIISAYPSLAGQAPQMANKAVTDNTNRIPGLDDDLEHAGTTVDETGARRESYQRPLKTTGEITESDVAREGVDPNSIPRKDWPAAIARARAGREGKLTEMQSNALQYSARMASNRAILEGLESKGFDPISTKNAATSKLPNITRNADNQAYLSARDNWVAAVLRKESGAAISQSEYDNAYKQYFPQYGDAPEVLKQKSDLRRITEDNMRLVAGGKAVDAETKPREVLPPAAKTEVPTINSQAEYDALPKGAQYRDSQGKAATKR